MAMTAAQRAFCAFLCGSLKTVKPWNFPKSLFIVATGFDWGCELISFGVCTAACVSECAVLTFTARLNLWRKWFQSRFLNARRSSQMTYVQWQVTSMPQCIWRLLGSLGFQRLLLTGQAVHSCIFPATGCRHLRCILRNIMPLHVSGAQTNVHAC